MGSTEDLIESFEAIDDEGNVGTIHIYQATHHMDHLDGRRTSRPGLKRAVTAAGYHLNPVGRDGKQFEVVETGEILTRIEE